MRPVRHVLSLAVVTLLSACGSRAPEAGRAVAPVVVQGAMDIEVRRLTTLLEHPLEVQVQGWTFWTGSLAGYPVVVSKTFKGGANAAAATVLALEHFHPVAIINQGTAGGHDPALHVSDIVIGIEAVNIGAFKTGNRDRGAGSDFSEWTPLDLLRSDGSAGQDPQARVMRRFAADPTLLAAARTVSAQSGPWRVVEGVIGSSDMWNSELDRISRFHSEFGTSAEEMETAPAAQVAGIGHVPFLGIRVLSNNITNGEPYNGQTAEACQTFVAQVVRAFTEQRKH